MVLPSEIIRMKNCRRDDEHVADDEGILDEERRESMREAVKEEAGSFDEG